PRPPPSYRTPCALPGAASAATRARRCRRAPALRGLRTHRRSRARAQATHPRVCETGAMSQQQNFRIPTSALTLEFPLSLGVYEKYEQAQQAVDYLSDHEFPVQNCLIVGTDLKQIERVTGRLTYGKVATGGLLSGIWMGLFVGLVVSLFSTGSSTIAIILGTMLFGAI